MEEKAITIQDSGAAIMPIVSADAMLARYKTIVEIKDKIMQKDTDYGVIPGTDRPTLLKPGAEKLCTAFGLYPEFEALDEVVEFEGDEPLIFYRYRCTLHTRDGRFTVGSGIGSCNSRESKYRWRYAALVCPDCGEELRRSKKGPGYYCWVKTGGCGATFPPNDPRIEEQETGRIPNPDIASQVNTIDKQAQKRALVAATLIAVGASDFYTQDLEDLPEVVNGNVTEVQANNPGETEPDGDKRICDMTGKEINQRIWKPGLERTGCKHRNHFENRYKKRFGVEKINDITVPESRFWYVMEAEEWPEPEERELDAATMELGEAPEWAEDAAR